MSINEKFWYSTRGISFLNVPEEMVEKSASQSADGISKVKDDNFWQWVLRSIECSQCGLQLAYHNEEKYSVPYKQTFIPWKQLR